jgi:hypothetical protein
LKIVDEAEWDLSGMRDRDRAQRLLRAMPPENLIDRVTREALDSELSLCASWRLEPGTSMVGCSRVIVVIPLTVDTFDDLINGRCGYRAQYYLSVLDGEHFNKALVTSLCGAAKQIFDHNPKSPGWPVVERSIMGPHSKIGVYGNAEPFRDAPQGEFRPRQWIHRAHTIWLRAPLSQHPAIELKGTWLDDKDQSYRPDPTKSDRDKVYHECGGA